MGRGQSWQTNVSIFEPFWLTVCLGQSKLQHSHLAWPQSPSQSARNLQQRDSPLQALLERGISLCRSSWEIQQGHGVPCTESRPSQASTSCTWVAWSHGRCGVQWLAWLSVEGRVGKSWSIVCVCACVCVCVCVCVCACACVLIKCGNGASMIILTKVQRTNHFLKLRPSQS